MEHELLTQIKADGFISKAILDDTIKSLDMSKSDFINWCNENNIDIIEDIDIDNVIDIDVEQELKEDYSHLDEVTDIFYADPLTQYLHSIRKFEVLEHEVIVDLFKKYYNGDMVAREKIINHNLKLVVSIAKFYKYSSIELLDIIQYGNIGLMKAIEKFDVSKNIKFSTYATWWINQSIMRNLQESEIIRIPAGTHQIINKMNRLTNEYLKTHSTPPPDSYLMKELNLNPEQLFNLKIYNNNKTVVSLSTPVGDEEDSTLEDFIPNENEIDIDNINMKKEFRTRILHILDTDKKFDEREKDVIIKRFGLDGNDPKTLLQIAKERNTGKENIRQIEAKALRKLRHPSVSRLLISFYENM